MVEHARPTIIVLDLYSCDTRASRSISIAPQASRSGMRDDLRFNFLKSLHDKSATVLVVGAGFIGVEWATEIRHFFPRVPGMQTWRR